MSEFTFGVVFEKRHEQTVQEKVTDSFNHIIKPLKEKWAVLLLEDDVKKHPKSKPMLMTLSDTVPLMLFVNAEDHEWGYEILDKGKTVANYLRDYDLEQNLIFDLATKRYPSQDLTELLYLSANSPYKALQQEVQSSDAYLDNISNRYNQANPEAFSLFSVDESKVATLKRLLSHDSNVSEKEEVEQFKKILALNELVFTNYQSAVDDSCC